MRRKPLILCCIFNSAAISRRESSKSGGVRKFISRITSLIFPISCTVSRASAFIAALILPLRFLPSVPPVLHSRPVHSTSSLPSRSPRWLRYDESETRRLRRLRAHRTRGALLVKISALRGPAEGRTPLRDLGPSPLLAQVPLSGHCIARKREHTVCMQIGPPPRFSIKITSARPATTSKSRLGAISPKETPVIRDSRFPPLPAASREVDYRGIWCSIKRPREAAGTCRMRAAAFQSRFAIHFPPLLPLFFPFFFLLYGEYCKEMENGNSTRFACNS